jgi:hypothetical protein
MEAVSADIWVLTETRSSITPGGAYCGIHSPAHLSRRPDADERWVSVWSRWPIQTANVRVSPWSVTGIVHSPFGRLIIHGMVLPYRHEPTNVAGESPVWAEFSRELSLQAQDWVAVRHQHGGLPLIVVGDFNQNLDGAQWYGTPATRRQLALGLDVAGLRCLTMDDAVATGRLRRNHLVDHVCVSTDLAPAGEFDCWEPLAEDGKAISDHPGVVARLRAVMDGD